MRRAAARGRRAERPYLASSAAGSTAELSTGVVLSGSAAVAVDTAGVLELRGAAAAVLIGAALAGRSDAK